ncbi:hypothetical protein [Bacteroides helcogenes]|uniref:Uncharacterized protein n=1 Tax=Bacteroides helcogenes (strain ATCC 35417 / DSM 20613 / JCM 6297 / CCUG 15421 / P 36-108) TaxID=693979 RepID=E6STP1_BACT6|nr:hypothetical protein [Bacteroides helcogenes]ADV44288.1 hypothetical protein Bache_2320 [Bacteroides helcogenes P 36-108]MDY5238299.1 hypothetical protein [Bacteroides helcogenes]
MNTKTSILSALLCLSGTAVLYSQETITEANYLKQDSLLWAEYESRTAELSQYWKTNPEVKDSIQHVYQKVYRKASEGNIALAMKYASVPSGLQRLYMVRLDISKDTLQSILNNLSTDMQESFYGKNIREHIQTRQIQEGDSISTFPCIQSDEKPFDWNATEGKQLLILYGGLGCMGEDGRRELKELYDRTSRKNLLVAVYWPCASLAELQEIKQAYPSEYTFVSDFKRDASPIKIKYGTQATPTCFLTDKQHVVKVKCTGLRINLFNPHIED